MATRLIKAITGGALALAVLAPGGAALAHDDHHQDPPSSASGHHHDGDGGYCYDHASYDHGEERHHGGHDGSHHGW